jgi:hypothetical protein
MGIEMTDQEDWIECWKCNGSGNTHTRGTDMTERYEENLSILPHHMRSGMKLWIERGIEPGSFLTAVLCNDLMTALGKADDINCHRLFDYGVYLYNYAPSGCYGSPEKVARWLAAGGLLGKIETA